MKPCDCDQEVKVNKLQEQGLCYNGEIIIVDSAGVKIQIGVCTMKIHHKRFKQFAEWYLENQGEVNGKK